MTPIQRFPIYKVVVTDSAGPLDLITFLSPEEWNRLGGLPSAVVAGKLLGPGNELSPSNFAGNRSFVEFLQVFIRGVAPQISEFVEAAARQGSGWLHVLDARALDDDPNLARADIIGSFPLEQGKMMEDSYAPNPNHQILTKHGFLAPHNEIQSRLLAVMRALPFPEPVVANNAGEKDESTKAPEHSLISEIAAERHNELYHRACQMIQGQVFLDNVPQTGTLGWFGRRRLRKAIQLFQKAIALNPSAWVSMLLVGKIYQRLADSDSALRWFLRANKLAPTNRSAAKEAGGAAICAGQVDLAVRVLQLAAMHNPADGALWYNIGTAYLLSGRASLARAAFEASASLDPTYPHTARLAKLAGNVESGSRTCPRSESEIAGVL